MPPVPPAPDTAKPDDSRLAFPDWPDRGDPLAGFACPACGSGLAAVPPGLHCARCGARYPVRDGVLELASESAYWGEIPRPDMEALLAEIERGRPWRDAVAKSERESVRRKAAFILDSRRANWILDLPIGHAPEILDIGAGLGSVAAALAPYARRVIALEPVSLRARFIARRCAEDGLANVVVAQGSALALPMLPASIDVAVLSGVLEWVGKGSRHPGRTQLAVLKAIRRVLRPGGALVIGIENRIGIWFFLGRQDHSYLPFTSLLPRPVASLVTRIARGHPYDTYTYTHRGYRRLLRAAGFDTVSTVLPIWSYNAPDYLVPLAPGPRAEIAAELMGTGGRAAKRPFVRRAHVAARLSGSLANDFIFYARGAGNGSASNEMGFLRQALAPRWPTYGLPGEATELTFLILNRSQPTVIAFAENAALPCAVLRLAPRGAFSAAGHEIRSLERLHAELPPALAQSLPKPLDLLTTDGHEIGVTTYVPGTPLLLPAEATERGGLAEVGALAERALAWLGEVHGALARHAGPREGGGEWPLLTGEELADSVLARLDSARLPNGAELESALGAKLRGAPPLGQVARLPQHGDFVLPNLRAQPVGSLGVIDWERFGRVPMPGFDALLFVTYAIICLKANPRTQVVDPLQVTRELLDPGPIGAVMRAPLERYLSAQGFRAGVLPVLYPAFLAAFLGEYGAERGRGIIVGTIAKLLATAFPPTAEER
jgi:SAM-dependent methyltransferase